MLIQYNIGGKNQGQFQKFVSNAEQNFAHLNIYLWMHGVGFSNKFRWVRKNILTFVLSSVCAFISIACEVYDTFAAFYASEHISKFQVIVATISFVNVLQRVILYTRRRKLNWLIRRISVLYVTQAECNQTCWKMRLSVILLMFDSLYLVSFLTINYILRLDYFYRKFPYGIIPPPHGWRVYKLFNFLIYWTNTNPSITFYFCYVCVVLKQTFDTLKQKLKRDMNVNDHHMVQIISNVINLSSQINNVFHQLLTTSFLSIFLLLLLTFHYILYNGINVTIGIFLFLPSFCYALCLFSICIISSTITKEIIEIKEHLQTRNIETTEHIRFLIDETAKFKGFTLCDSTPIDNKLLLSGVQAFFTYSVFLAILNIAL